jgi:hypothetical protein
MLQTLTKMVVVVSVMNLVPERKLNFKNFFCVNIDLSCMTNKETKQNGRYVKLTVVELVSNIASVVRDTEHPPVSTLCRAVPVSTMTKYFVTMHFKIL